ncbi:MAG: DNA polymerase IV [Treponema sp.]
MQEDFTKCFFHVDLDAFYASVEQLVHPEYRNKPVIISGNPHQRRNVVSTASYEARKFGVHSAMPAIKAFELCPQGIFVEPNMKLYFEYSEKVMAILKDFSPDILQLSIDEACLDMTGTSRLFGKPEEAAKKIKETVKEKIGLTISIGIATNAYLAKICSDIKKPDGLFQILPGEEENFMENLPLKKIWGVGEKTLARLNSSGFKTVSDIKKHSKNFLKGIFGEATASFLYNVSRGLEPENFRSEPKSHSLSAETTFEFDLTERNAIETSLLELCSEVMERLLKNNLTSFTVHLKIRYEDFSTVNIQSTFETPVLCTDDFFARACALFDKKYDSPRGIRLLGVGVQNAVSSSQIVQPELFESENKKKQIIEKTILDIESKHPDVKIHKARLLHKTKIILAFLLLLFCNAKNAESQSQSGNSVRPEQTTVNAQNAGTINDDFLLEPKARQNGTSLFNYGNEAFNIEFIADGFWNLKLSQTTTATFGYGKDFSTSVSLPVFEQNVDLSLWFLLNNHWYIQGAFADKFNKNTIALGYYGDGIVKDVKISNRNIVFPDTYSLSDISRSIGGGDNQAPGISAKFSDKKWTVDTAFRYDMLSTFDKTYYGKNAVNNLKISKENFLTGSIYVLPNSENVRHIISVYVESSQGTFTDEAGRKYKKISSNDFLILPSRNQLILSKDAGAGKTNGVLPCILVEFDSAASMILSSDLGKYGTATSAGSGYLGEIQNFFGSRLQKSKFKIPDVASFSYGAKKGSLSVPDKTGDKTDGFFVLLDSKEMLLLQNSSGFSPFAAAFRYDGGTSQIQDVQVASASTETQSKTYSAVIADTIDTMKSDFFYTKRVYVDVYNQDYTLSSTAASGKKITYSSPEINFPFADVSPGTYLGFDSSNDECIMLKSFTQSSRIDIGTKAVAGTVYVYKNGILDSSAKYNSQTGEVTLLSGISDSDKIYITWCEESSDSKSGMLAGAIGFKYDFLENLSGDIAAATRWSLSPDLQYAEYNRPANAYTTISSRINWQEEKLSISNTIGATLQIDNITGNYKISSLDSSKPSTAYLTQSAAKNLPSNFTPFINLRQNESPSAKAPELTSANNCSVEKQQGSLDSEISGYKIPVSYNFANANDTLGPDEVLWASNTVALNSAKGILSSASKFSLAVKLSQEFCQLAQSSSDTKIYLQLGVSSEEDFTIENKGNIPTWKIFDSDSNAVCFDVESPVSLSADKWQTVSVTVTDIDRAFFSENYNARIIITTSKKPENAGLYSGTVFIGPYEAVTQGIYTAADKGFSVSTEQVKQTNPGASKFNKESNYTQNVNWTIDSFTAAEISSSISDSKITLYKYFDEVDFSSYKNVNLYFSYSVSSVLGQEPIDPTSVPGLQYDDFPLTVIFDRDAPSATEDGSKAVELKIHSASLKEFIDYEANILGACSKIHKLEINQISKEVFIDGKKIDGVSLYVNPNVIPTRVKIKVDSITEHNDSSKYGDSPHIYQKGRFSIDELYLSDNSPKVILQDQLKANFKHDGDIIQIKNFPLLKDANLSATGNFTGTLHTDNSFTDKFTLSGNANAGITIATVKITNEIGKSSESKNNITSAGHTIKTTQPVLKFASLEESFLTNKDDKSVTKENSATFNFNNFHLPLILKGTAKVSSDSWAVTQDINNSLQFSAGNKFKYTFLASVKANQKKLPGNQGVEKISTSNYFDTWLESSKFQFSTGDSLASKRIINGSVSNTFSFPFASFAPQITFSENGTYTSSSQTTYSDTTNFTTAFPFKLGSQNFSFSYSKSSSLIQNVEKGGSYCTDIETMCTSMSKRDWYFLAFPVYDLISGELADKVLNTLPEVEKQSELTGGTIAQSAGYNGSYNFSWKRPLFASKYDLFVPAIATLSFARDISTAENIADTYQLKGTVGYTSINIFSANGSFPVLKWCSSDEYNFSFQSTLKIPRNDPESIKQLYSVYLQANFYRTQEDVLRTALQFSFQDTANWNGKATLLYKRQTHFTPVLEIVKLFNRNFDYSNVNISRTNSLNFTISSSQASSTNSKPKEYQSVELSHLIEFQILKQFSINASISGIFTHTKDEVCSVSCTLGLGGKLQF